MRLIFLFSTILYFDSFAGPIEDLTTWLQTNGNSRPEISTQTFSTTPLTASQADQARTLIWADRIEFVKSDRTSQWTNKELVDVNNFKMPFEYIVKGAKPASGYDFYISMHGGGGTTQQVNDQQWQNQIILYEPDGVYLAPRSPTNTWNMWHQAHIDGFFDRLIQLTVAYLDVNVNRVYLMGYSAGGDGAYQMAPRMADRWAASAMMAGYPNNASPINLRNSPLAIHVGELDGAYGRNTIAVTFANEIQALQDQDEPGFYQYQLQVHQGLGHWMQLQDAVALPWMAGFTRNPNPSKVVWHQDTTVGTNSFPGGPIVVVPGKTIQNQFYWISLKEGTPEFPTALITTEIRGQEIHIEESNKDPFIISLNDSLINLDQNVSVFWKGTKIYQGIPTRNILNLWNSINGRGDYEYSYPAQLEVSASDVSIANGPTRESKIKMITYSNQLKIKFEKRFSGDLTIKSIDGQLIIKSTIINHKEIWVPFISKKGVFILNINSESMNISQIFIH